MAFQYQTLSDGTVQVWNGAAWETPWPSNAEIALFNKLTTQWYGMVSDAVARYGLPPVITYLVLAIIYSESNGGDPNIGPTFDGGVGLMAITSSDLKKKPGGGYYTADELKDPSLNIDIGVGKVIAPEFAIMGDDRPQIASGFNGGYCKAIGPKCPALGAHPSSSSPWGWKEYVIPKTGAQPYISKVIRINNYAISTLGGQVPPTPPGEGSVEGGASNVGTAFALGSLALLGFALWKKGYLG